MDLTDACLCLSALPDFMKNDPVVSLAVTILGEPSVTGLLTNLVRRKFTCALKCV